MEASGDDGYDEEDKTEDDDEESKSTAIDIGLNEFAKKIPIFEPEERAEYLSESQEKPLTVNLDLALYRAKVLTRNYRYAEAEDILQKVRFFFFFSSYQIEKSSFINYYF